MTREDSNKVLARMDELRAELKKIPRRTIVPEKKKRQEELRHELIVLNRSVPVEFAKPSSPEAPASAKVEGA